jgi:putative membrane protein
MNSLEQSSRRRGLLRFIARLLVIWGIEVLGLLVMAWLLPGVTVNSLATAVIAVAAIGLVNAVLWPVLSYLVLPFAVFTLGLVSLVLNASLTILASRFVEGFIVTGLWDAILLTLGLTAINTVVSSLLTIDDDNSYYRNIVQRRIKRRKKPVETDVPGVLFLEIDGLAKPVLERALREGHMPALAAWTDAGSHRVVGWETDLSCQTSASQAGILHGNNQNIPAFRWWDRGRREIVSSSAAKELSGLEKKRSNGNGLLAKDGASRGNMFSGDAPNVMLTGSTITDLSRFHATDFDTYFVNPYNISRTLLLTLREILAEIWQFWRTRRNEVYPILGRDKRGGVYPLLRAFTSVVMRELNIYTLIGDMFAGVPAAYATFVGYDEVAHHSGVEAPETFDVLRRLDQQLARLEAAARQAPRPYHFVILSDHGQSAGATFKQRYQMTLEELVQQLATEKYSVVGDVDVHEDWGQISAFLTETMQSERKAVSVPVGQALRGRTREGRVILGPEAGRSGSHKESTDAPGKIVRHIAVLASGNLGLVYGTDLEKRATMEQIEAVYPGVLEGLVNHDGIAFVMVHSEAYGPVVVGSGGRCYLRDGRVEGESPLKGFGANTAAHLRRTDSFPDAPDVLVNSFYNPETNEVAAFEELIGSHGGLGGWQTEPFLLYPAEWELAPEPIVGAEALHHVLKGWVDQLTVEDDSAPDGAG